MSSSVAVGSVALVMGQAVVGVALELEIVDVAGTVVGPLGEMVGFGVRRVGSAIGAAPVSHDQVEPLINGREPSTASQPERATLAIEHVADDLGGVAVEMGEERGGNGFAVDEFGVAGLGGDHEMHEVLHVSKVAARLFAGDELDERVEPALGG